MMPVIRSAAAADLDAVMRLAAVPEAPHWDRAAYESFLSSSHPASQLFIAESPGKITGFAAARIALDTCELESIAVAPEARRSGIGAHLLANLIEWSRKQGAARVQLEVRAQNHSAIAFHRAAGFQSDGLRRAYYRDPEDDALLMSLSLVPPPAAQSQNEKFPQNLR